MIRRYCLMFATLLFALAVLEHCGIDDWRTLVFACLLGFGWPMPKGGHPC